jgi:hypothetical protein
METVIPNDYSVFDTTFRDGIDDELSRLVRFRSRQCARQLRIDACVCVCVCVCVRVATNQDARNGGREPGNSHGW